MFIFVSISLYRLPYKDNRIVRQSFTKKSSIIVGLYKTLLFYNPVKPQGVFIVPTFLYLFFKK